MIGLLSQLVMGDSQEEGSLLTVVSAFLQGKWLFSAQGLGAHDITHLASVCIQFLRLDNVELESWLSS